MEWEAENNAPKGFKEEAARTASRNNGASLVPCGVGLRPRHLLAALLLSCAFYLVLHLGVLRKPLTVGYVRQLTALKEARVEAIGTQPKLAIVSGSNGLFSLRCAVLEEALKWPCANLALPAGIGLNLILAHAKEWLHPGDVVLLPLEYDFYAQPARAQRLGSMGNHYMATYDRSLLTQVSAERQVAALFSLSLKDALASGVEMALAAAGVKRRFHIARITPHGDMGGHGEEEAAGYVDLLRDLPPPVWEGLNPEPGGSLDALSRFLDWASARNIRVIALPPTTAEDMVQTPDMARALRVYYADHHVRWLALPQGGRYPRTAFYDTLYHLTEPFQLRHSRLVAEEVKGLLKEEAQQE